MATTPGDSEGPTVEAGDATFAPGAFGAFTITVADAKHIGFDGQLYECGDNGPVSFESVDISPSPDKQLDSCPPGWIWNDCTAVELEVAVEVAEDADPDEYEYALSASGCDEREREYRGTVTVTAE